MSNEGNTRVKGAKSEERIPFTMTTEELEAFEKARAKEDPLAPRSAVIRKLIAEYVKKARK
jgi:hypothetical protein